MSTNDQSTYSQFQLVPAYGSSLDNKSEGDASGTATYLDLIVNSDVFWDKLRDLLQSSGKIVKIPNVGGESLDLHKLFVEVTTRGGIEKVIKDRKCKEVIGTFNLKTEVKNAAYVLRKTYLKMLFELEHVYFFKEPMSSFWAREEAMKQLVDESANHDIGIPDLQPGTLLKGFIDGKFENGYFVTMKTKTKLSQYRRLEPEYAGQEPFLKEESGNTLSESGRKVYLEKVHENVERFNTEMPEYTSFINSWGDESVAAIDAATADANGDAAEAETESDAEKSR